MEAAQAGDAQIADEIIAIIAGRSRGGARPALSDSLDELGIDSMGLLDIAFAIEEKFQIELPFNANTDDFATVGDLVKAAEGVITERAGSR